MRDRIVKVAVPVSLLLALGILQIPHIHSPLVFFATAMLPVMALMYERPVEKPLIPVALGLLLLLCPATLRREVVALTGMTLIILVVAALSAIMIVSTAISALSCRLSQRWLQNFVIASDRSLAVVRAELSLGWFALFRRRATQADHPADALPFACTSRGRDVAMAWVAATSGLIEAPLFHLMLRRFSASGAWIAAGLTIVISLYFVGFAKSLAFCPTLLFTDSLVIRLGAVASTMLKRSEIDQVRLLHSASPKTAGAVRLFAFENPNVAVRAAGRDYLFRVDHPQQLIRALHPT
jgi:hypothetical protein